MRIFYAFLILVLAALLWLIPITEVVYDFRTDVKSDSFYVATGVGVTTGNVTLHDSLYDDDTSTLEVSSDLATDVPVASSCNTTTRLTTIGGLSANTTRTLELTYDVDALHGSDAWDNVLNLIPTIWMVIIVIFPMAAIAAIFVGRA